MADEATGVSPQVEIMTSNTNKLEVIPQDQQEPSQETPKTAEEVKAGEDPAKAPEVEPSTDEKSEADIKAAQKAEEDLKTDLGSKGIDFNTLEAEFSEKGELSEESYKALEKAGYPRSAVDAYTTGLKAQAEQYVTRVTALAGGPENLKTIQTYLTAPENRNTALAFNAAIEAGSIKQVELVINGINAEITSKYGTANASILGGSQVPSTVTGFKTQAEMTSAMSDPKYGRDPVYTKAVRAKVAASQGIF
ncbi:hypothetical protein SPFL3102_03578 [Sporomusaceae bacterium FL31]|nr:hypothetical protein SPFL3101_00427 [Sporomusaceae bacterium FL31]GCE35727.1 hypothetical protein SPFL3102_03578 [Sporomusaceae bacterium]